MGNHQVLFLNMVFRMMKPFVDSHTGTNILKEPNAIAERCNISHIKIHLVVHDSVANVSEGVQDAENYSVKCFIHSLYRFVEESLKS